MPELFKGKESFPDWWKDLPIEPKFGSLTDLYGGSRVSLVDGEVENWETYFGGAAENTSRGTIIVERTARNETRVIAEDLGIALLYGREGKLESASVNLLTYFSNVNSEDLELVGGEEMIDMMQDLDAEDKDLNIVFNLRDKFLLVVNARGESVTKEYFVTDLNYVRGERLEIGYGRHQLNLVLQNKEDVFLFSIMVAEKSEDDWQARASTRILSDCNIKTYLESHHADKIERLARRIFF